MEFKVKTIKTDVLVIGSGGAGARAAIEAANNGTEVLLTSKGPITRSGITPLADGGMTAVLSIDDRDSPEQHFKDIIQEGRFLSDWNLAFALAKDAPKRIQELIAYGIKFMMSSGKLLQLSSPGETYPRSIYLEGGGHQLMLGLKRQISYNLNITLMEDTLIIELTKQNDRVNGAAGINMRTGELLLISAGAVILATGGNEQLWPHTDTPPQAVGDGCYLAYQAGAELVDLELIQFYPLVAIYPESVKGTLITYEVVLDPELCGGKLINAHDEEFLSYNPLPSRDILIKQIFSEIAKGRGTAHGGVYLDLTLSDIQKPRIEKSIQEMIPHTHKYLQDLDVKLLEDRIEVAPGTHFTLGGVHIDEWGQTSIKGLFAAGEVAGNLHGGNRAANNALTETQVFGYRAGKKAARYASSVNNRDFDPSILLQFERKLNAFFQVKDSPVRPDKLKRKIKELMSKYVGFERSETGLKRALQELSIIRQQSEQIGIPETLYYNLQLQEAIEVEIMINVAEMIILSALERTESRGHHYRRDFPQDNPDWLVHTLISKEQDQMKIAKKAINYELSI